MPDTTINENVLTALYNIEAAISENFKSMMASDAMLSIEMELQEIKTADSEELLGQFNSSVQLFQSTLEWNDQTGRNLFLMREEDANALLAQVTVQNEAIDSLDVIFANWNLAATQFLEEKLGQAPAFGEITSETRELNNDDLQPDELWSIYQIKLGDNQYEIHRICASFWQVMAEAANIDVTTVDDIDSSSVSGLDAEQIEVENVDFGNLNPEISEDDSIGSIEVLYDLKLDLVVELGRTKKPIREILELARGSIIELEKLAGDPVEIYVNDKKLAEGEVVVVDDHFGVRITNLLKPEDRIKSLGEA
ncbi:MAG: flagellar motor switch protein FliN [candidate division KSB1 bacterium]|nr:flagellar motor switch protein FliN [candidate division KSB1 bacterium]